jgi:hypothetical protein
MGGQRVLARAAPEHEHSHRHGAFGGWNPMIRSRLRDAQLMHTASCGRDYFVDLGVSLRLESAFTCDSLTYLVIWSFSSSSRRSLPPAKGV